MLAADEPHGWRRFQNVVNPTVSDWYQLQCCCAQILLRCVLALAAGSTSVGLIAMRCSYLSVRGRDGSRTECCPGLRISNRGSLGEQSMQQ